MAGGEKESFVTYLIFIPFILKVKEIHAVKSSPKNLTTQR